MTSKFGQIDVLPYSLQDDAEWDEFVKQSRNGTLFHTRRFLAYHPPDRFDDASLLLRREGRLIAVLPAAWAQDPEIGLVLQSHPGASYGGPVFGMKCKTKHVHAVVEAICLHAQMCGANAIQMRMPPHVFHRSPMEELDFVLRLQGFRIWRTELSTWISLPGPDYDLFDAMTQAHRNAIRKAIRASLEAGDSEDFQPFWDLLAENLRRRYDTTPTHSKEELVALHERFPEQIRLFATYEKGALIAGTVIFLCNDETAHVFYMAGQKEAQRLAPLNLAVYAAMRWLQDQGFRRLNFGVSTPDGKSVNWGLLAFKESFGGRGVTRDTYRMTFADKEPTRDEPEARCRIETYALPRC